VSSADGCTARPSARVSDRSAPPDLVTEAACDRVADLSTAMCGGDELAGACRTCLVDAAPRDVGSYLDFVAQQTAAVDARFLLAGAVACPLRFSVPPFCCSLPPAPLLGARPAGVRRVPRAAQQPAGRGRAGAPHPRPVPG